MIDTPYIYAFAGFAAAFFIYELLHDPDKEFHKDYDKVLQLEKYKVKGQYER